MQDINQLFKRYIANQCTPEEVRELLKHFDDEAHKAELKELIGLYLKSEVSPKIEAKIGNSNIFDQTDEHFKTLLYRKPFIVRLVKHRLFKYAASVVLVIGLGLFLLNQSKEAKKTIDSPTAMVISPGSNKAILKLSDGRTVILDNHNKKELISDSYSQIKKAKDGLLVYEPIAGNGSDRTASLNELQTPAGGKYEVVLADGTKVLLNSMSTLKYPQSFDDEQRVVELVGEAYFTVAERYNNHKKIPFIVKTSKQTIEVVGTQFNISSYPDDSFQKTTLVSGRVNVTNNSTQQKYQLVPDQEAYSDENNRMNIANANTESAIAWTQGKFRFEDAYLKDILKQLSRWYNVKVDYSNVPTTRYNIALSRNESLNSLLKKLEQTGSLKFQIENNTIKTIK